MRTLRVAWIDDREDKVEHYRRAIEAGVDGMRARVELVRVTSGLLDVLAGWAENKKGAPPDLIVIDHVYNPPLPFGARGSSVAHLLRREFPTVPMVCVTAMFDRPHSFNQEDISEYTAVFLYQQLENHIEELFAIARDFKKLRLRETSFREHLIGCLKPPRRDKGDLLRLLPEEFQDAKHVTTEHRAARWILGTFVRQPGFLYDRLHAATLLGLSEGGFAKVEARFAKARYRGAFATERYPRWWVSTLRTQLFEVLGEDAPDLPQHAGRTLPGIVAADFSVCYVSKSVEPPPDAVVAADVTSDTKLRVVQRQFADVHPNHPGVVPGFESTLILKPTRR